MTGERMPRRPVHPGPEKTLGARIVAMLRDARTWTTLAYFLLMLPLGIAYFVIAVVGLAVGVGFVVAPLLGTLWDLNVVGGSIDQFWFVSLPVHLVLTVVGILILTTLMHVARGIGHLHARVAKRLLVTPG